MSRAFVRETDDRPELPPARPATNLPAGAKNYLTQHGAERLRSELTRLLETERPRTAAADDADSKAELRALNSRIEQIGDTLRTAEVVSDPEGATDVVRFGARVTVRNRRGEESTYRIVGLDEVEFDDDAVSWISPIARALTGAKVGDLVRFRFPSGEDELTILRVQYGSAS